MSHPSNPRKIEILLVEDSETDRMLAREVLRESRVANHVHWVEDGEEAMKFLRQEGQYDQAPSPDLILLDLNLPKKDGREVLTEIKTDELFRYIPVVVLTTSQANEDILGAYGVHANCYITKPLDFNQFGHVIQTLENFWFEVVTLPHAADAPVPPQVLTENTSFSVPSVAKLETEKVIRVLVIEDSPSDQLLIEAALGESPRVVFEPTCVKRMADAKRALESGNFEVIVTDLGLPDSQGVDSVQSIVKLAAGIPVVVLTALDSDEVGLQALQYGAADYVVKGEMSGRTLTRTIRYAVDRSRIEDQMRHAQRMESLGVLAGGIAHDFNNLLMVIKGNSELQQRLKIDSPKLDKISHQISSAADRAATLTRQLLGFSRRERVHLSNLDFNAMLTEFSRMIQRLIGPTIEFELKLTDEPTTVSGDPGLLEQVILNLVINSRDAMPEGGELTIQTAYVDIQADRGEGVPPAGPGRYLSMLVTDTGTGMSSTIQDRIFEPFFTTKGLGKGTGLGLSTAFGIVQQHRGTIEVRSKVGAGTEFRVLLPAVDAQKDTNSDLVNAAPAGNGEVVLVVDDEELVLELCASFLEMHGYTAIKASSGAEVIDRWPELKDKVDLVLTDLIMPQGVSGHDLGTWLYEQNPDLKIVYCSGFSQANIRRRFKLREGTNFLSKPFSADSLLNTVHQILAKKRE